MERETGVGHFSLSVCLHGMDKSKDAVHLECILSAIQSCKCDMSGTIIKL